MIVETEVEFFDSLGNSIVETLQIPINEDEDEDNVEAIVEDYINEWFIKTARETFEMEFPELKDTDEDDYIHNFIKYFNDVKLYSDLD